jgi:hypothetical protein
MPQVDAVPEQVYSVDIQSSGSRGDGYMSDRISQIFEFEERRAKKVESLKALLRDPELKDVVALLIGEVQSPLPQQPVQARTPSPKPAKRRKSQPYSNGVTAKLRSIGPKLPRPFVVPDAVGFLLGEGFQFPPQRVPKEAVRDALYFMVKDNDTYRIVERGGAGKLGKYEYMGVSM